MTFLKYRGLAYVATWLLQAAASRGPRWAPAGLGSPLVSRSRVTPQAAPRARLPPRRRPQPGSATALWHARPGQGAAGLPRGRRPWPRPSRRRPGALLPAAHLSSGPAPAGRRLRTRRAPPGSSLSPGSAQSRAGAGGATELRTGARASPRRPGSAASPHLPPTSSFGSPADDAT
ncbi:uncharacterized protein [Notamacropus eugenii]|uniref:uncharacterized protein n=1 Tax=Notamacropus eugenii TaxID=9315 RepID=UPI003B67EC6F